MRRFGGAAAAFGAAAVLGGCATAAAGAPMDRERPWIANTPPTW